MTTGGRPRAFAQVDVFSTEPFLGNPVAVVLDADGLDDQAMQRIAAWINLSETTFLLPPTTPDADYRLRIFTPRAELPFAGHPTLGSAHAWLEAGNVPRAEGRVVQECAAGLVTLARRRGDLYFAAPPTVRSGPLDGAHLTALTGALGIADFAVIGHQWVDNGPGWALVQLETAGEVLALEPDFTRLPDAMVGVIGAAPPGADHAFDIRAFAPRIGVHEDPVTGSLNAGVAQWMLATGRSSGDYVVAQGRCVGRAGRVRISPDAEGNVWLGGATTTRIRGSLTA